MLIIDGYNAIYAIPQIERHLDKSLEDARKALLCFLAAWQKERKHKRKICIVFDGKDGFYHPDAAIGGIRSIFTNTRKKADDRIISIIRNAENPGKITVISNDNNVTNNCRAHGAKVEPVRFLLPVKRKNEGSEKSEKRLDAAAVRDINAWLKKEWEK